MPSCPLSQPGRCPGMTFLSNLRTNSAQDTETDKDVDIEINRDIDAGTDAGTTQSRPLHQDWVFLGRGELIKRNK